MLFYVFLCVDCVVLCIVCVDCVVLCIVCVDCVVLCVVSIVLFCVLFVSTLLFRVFFVCKCVLCYCHRVSTQLQLTNISNIIQFSKECLHTRLSGVYRLKSEHRSSN